VLLISYKMQISWFSKVFLYKPLHSLAISDQSISSGLALKQEKTYRQVLGWASESYGIGQIKKTDTMECQQAPLMPITPSLFWELIYNLQSHLGLNSTHLIYNAYSVIHSCCIKASFFPNLCARIQMQKFHVYGSIAQ